MSFGMVNTVISVQFQTLLTRLKYHLLKLTQKGVKTVKTIRIQNSKNNWNLEIILNAKKTKRKERIGKEEILLVERLKKNHEKIGDSSLDMQGARGDTK